MKQELIYLRHTGSYTLTCADILLHLLLGSVDSREGMQAGYRPSKSVSSSRKLSKSMISQQSSCRGCKHSQRRTVGACSGSDSGLHFGLSLLSSEFSSETRGPPFSSLPGVSTESGSLLPRNGYISRSRTCLLYTSPSPRDLSTSRMPSSA